MKKWFGIGLMAGIFLICGCNEAPPSRTTKLLRIKKTIAKQELQECFEQERLKSILKERLKKEYSEEEVSELEEEISAELLSRAEECVFEWLKDNREDLLEGYCKEKNESE